MQYQESLISYQTGGVMRCKRCFGRGFYLPTNGYTVADRVKCHKCGGTGTPAPKLAGELDSVVDMSWLGSKESKPREKMKRESLYRRYGVEV